MEWNLYTDGSVDRHPPKGDIIVPSAWAAILQKTPADPQSHESIPDAGVLFGAELGPSRASRMELKAVIEGLRAVKQGDSVRVFSDCLTTLACVIRGIQNVRKEYVSEFMHQLRPRDLSQTIVANHMRLFVRMKRGAPDPIESMEKWDGPLLKELRQLIVERDIMFTKVSDMKHLSGRKEFPTHVRCDEISRIMRLRLAGLTPADSVNRDSVQHYPFVPKETAKV